MQKILLAALIAGSVMKADSESPPTCYPCEDQVIAAEVETPTCARCSVPTVKDDPIPCPPCKAVIAIVACGAAVSLAAIFGRKTNW